MTEVINMLSYKGDDYVRIDRRSIFGNPFKIGWWFRKHGRGGEMSVLMFKTEFEGAQVITREVSIELYRQWFERKLREDAEFAERVEELRGKKLGCWCKPKACHGDVILEYLNKTA